MRELPRRRIFPWVKFSFQGPSESGKMIKSLRQFLEIPIISNQSSTAPSDILLSYINNMSTTYYMLLIVVVGVEKRGAH